MGDHTGRLPDTKDLLRLSQPLGREIPLHLLVLGCWLVAFGAAAVMEYAQHASLWFPPTAVTFAAVLVMGPRTLPILFLACVFVVLLNGQIFQRELSMSEVMLAGLSFGLTHTAAYGALALVIRAAADRDGPFGSFPRVNAFLLGGVVAAGVPAVLGSLSLITTRAAEAADITILIAPRWIGDYAGLITLGPLMVIALARAAHHLAVPTPGGLRAFVHPETPRQPWRRAGGKLLALALLTTGVLAIAATFPDSESLVFLLFLCLPLQLWIVHSETALASLLGILLFSLLLAAAASLSDLANQALMLQFIVISLAVSSHLGLAVPALYRDNFRMRQLLTHDSLTGALARNFFEDGAREGLQQCELKAEPACLVMIDLDNLKQINDQFGHAAGDRALKSLAEICASQLAPGQLLGRLGGDEFALFLGERTRSDVEALLKNIREALAQESARDPDAAAAASFGIAEFVPGAGPGDYQQLLAEADQAMYRDKRGAALSA